MKLCHHLNVAHRVVQECRLFDEYADHVAYPVGDIDEPYNFEKWHLAQGI